jgi:hypothetical protein
LVSLHFSAGAEQTVLEWAVNGLLPGMLYGFGVLWTTFAARCCCAALNGFILLFIQFELSVLRTLVFSILPSTCSLLLPVLCSFYLTRVILCFTIPSYGIRYAVLVLRVAHSSSLDARDPGLVVSCSALVRGAVVGIAYACTLPCLFLLWDMVRGSPCLDLPHLPFSPSCLVPLLLPASHCLPTLPTTCHVRRATAFHTEDGQHTLPAYAYGPSHTHRICLPLRRSGTYAFLRCYHLYFAYLWVTVMAAALLHVMAATSAGAA